MSESPTIPADPTTTAVVHTITHEDASDLPELSWGWRRGYIFAFTVLAMAIPYWVTYKTSDVLTLRYLARDCIKLVAFFSFLYIAGAGSEGVTRLVAAFRSTRKETISSAPPPSSITVTPSGGQNVTQSGPGRPAPTAGPASGLPSWVATAERAAASVGVKLPGT